MATILIDPYPATGHYNGSLQLALTLKNAGHKIIYVGSSEYQHKIEDLNFTFYPISPFLVDLRVNKENYWLDSFFSLFNNNRMKLALDVIREYDIAIKKISPDLILLDSNHIQKVGLYGKYKVRIVCFETMISPYYSPNIPPYSSKFIPKNTFISKLYVEFLWFFREVKLRLEMIEVFVIYFNNEFHGIYKKIASIHNVQISKWNSFKRMNRTKYIPSDIVELIIPPQSFDFPRNNRNDIIYIGPLLNIKNINNCFDERYEFVKKYIIQLRQINSTIKFIYVSLGTATDAAVNREKRFMRFLTEYCRSNSEHQFVFSVGKYYNISLLSLPKNLHIFNSVPQLDILKYCDFMITHGGMNTLTECILNEVPVIVFPLVREWDQNGNSARVIYHNIGLRGEISNMNVSKLKMLIDNMCANYNTYKSNIKKVNSSINIDDLKNKAVEIIESLII